MNKHHEVMNDTDEMAGMLCTEVLLDAPVFAQVMELCVYNLEKQDRSWFATDLCI